MAKTSRKSDAVSLEEFLESQQQIKKESVINMPRKKGEAYWGDSKDDYWIAETPFVTPAKSE